MQRANGKQTLIVLTAVSLLYPFKGSGTGHIMVYASDTSSPGAPPPASTVTLNGGSEKSFSSGNWIIFSGVEAGTHTVMVHTASGYLPCQSSTTEGSIEDPTSGYGVPREVIVVEDATAMPSFQFDPIISVSGVVRDAWTMERLENADIEFIINSGPSQNIVCSKYPWDAAYATDWRSDSSGHFPSNTYLYSPESYDLRITRAGYQQFTSNNVISNVSPGTVVNLSEIFLVPVDSNTNQIADAWETLYFGSGTNVSASADADGDGVCNRDEYIAGTDPTNQWSVLALGELVFSNQTAELTWDTTSWRTYRITGSTDLCTGEWVQVAGTWEATNGQTSMSWAETNLNLSWHSSYRVEVVPCYWQGTNQVLVNTNGWSTGGGGTGGGTNLPPIP